MKKVYMHTLNGYPAYFCGDQICFAGNNMGCLSNRTLKSSLKKIKEEQKKTVEYRKKAGFWSEGEEKKYGYKIFLVEE